MNTKNARFIRYCGSPIQGYPVSLWDDKSKDRYLWRITSPTTGKIVRTFISERELNEYRKELAK